MSPTARAQSSTSPSLPSAKLPSAKNHIHAAVVLLSGQPSFQRPVMPTSICHQEPLPSFGTDGFTMQKASEQRSAPQRLSVSPQALQALYCARVPALPTVVINAAATSERFGALNR